ncbi:MAG: SDR family oxidoreductase [Hyphomonadaceae bacterium]|nr:SDR family oxidoreductase [Hyphomonadaceae bacterium]
MQIRLNPVTLITGAGSGIGAGVARDLARRSTGGLLLADADEAALGVVADELDAAGVSPERVSTLAFDASDTSRWAQAATFIQGQYGRLDWAVVNTSAANKPAPAESDLVDWGGTTSAQLEATIQSLRTIMPMMARNAQGGAIVVTTAAAAIKAEPLKPNAAPGLLQVMRAASREAAHSNVRINAIAPGGADTPMWNEMPWFQDLVREAGSENAAFDKIAQSPRPLARYAQGQEVSRLIISLLAEEAHITGATLVVDGGGTL